jgi:hypothetical protein
MLRKEEEEVRLALSKDALKIKGMLRSEVICFNRDAISRVISMFSITQGPETRNRGCCCFSRILSKF